ncbi:uncharacterized protein [Leptinotarsa decemlineata]
MKVTQLLVVLISFFYFTQGIQVHHSSHAVAGTKDHGHGEHLSEHKHETSSGGSSKHDVEKRKKGQKGNVLHKIEHEEGGGKKSHHNSEDSHSSSKKHGGGSQHGLKFGEGSAKKKVNFKKGFSEQYHKDESINHDSFYSKADKNGEFEIFGQKHSKYKTQEFEKKNLGKHKKSGANNSHGRSSKKVGGHNKQAHKGHQAQSGSKSHAKHSNKYGRKSSNHGGKQYHFSTTPHK